eukprot:653662-Prorocentrum_minimum.AAC.2
MVADLKTGLAAAAGVAESDVTVDSITAQVRRVAREPSTVPQWKFTSPIDQSQSLNMNIPHPPTNGSPSIGTAATAVVITKSSLKTRVTLITYYSCYFYYYLFARAAYQNPLTKPTT